MAKWELLYTRLRKGYIPSVTKSRTEIITKFLGDFKRFGMTERDLVNKTPKELSMILLQLCHEKLYAVPYQLLTFNLKYFDAPRFVHKGPTSSIAELSAFHPESQRMFQRLVLPTNRTVSTDTTSAEADITSIPLAHIEKFGVPFSKVWIDFLRWINELPEPQPTVNHESLDGKGTFGYLPSLEKDGSAGQKVMLQRPITANKHLLNNKGNGDGDNEAEASHELGNIFRSRNQKILLISHGGKLADVSMLKWECRKADLTMPKQITFGDSYGVIKERHRRRPVTQNKLPAGDWSVKSLSMWMSLPEYENVPYSQALTDAINTWEVLEETLRRYGVEHLTAKQQLGEIFYKSAFD
eukprot:CAMPEP_0201530620 /NCGR_PEP_ID=MMETSP0161_2-20130828/45228_1 /ASSEMBLY_ACC=CAM_ASM_000251 /TAXON_ID=180227 /ORGANISM="Neoparamoeba aestuarina, Strain SoJaBio B1-5/56/2" /LENGTH=353 /DNA_ID=CAMNT_0047933063 /DNA_START=363 /DNA_END=1421 /DNA_ORIENTATION=+